MNDQESSDNIARPNFKKRPGSTGGGNGQDLDGRVSAIEAHLEHLATKDDVTGLKAHLEHLATKDDVTGLKVWVLGGVISTIIIAAGIAATVVKAFF